jgi:hypothetical protein
VEESGPLYMGHFSTGTPHILAERPGILRVFIGDPDLDRGHCPALEDNRVN